MSVKTNKWEHCHNGTQEAGRLRCLGRFLIQDEGRGNRILAVRTDDPHSLRADVLMPTARKVWGFDICPNCPAESAAGSDD